MDKLIEYQKELEGKTPEEILLWAVNKFGAGHIVQASSFGAEDQVITNMMEKTGVHVRIITLDTGRLFQETYNLIDLMMNEKKLDIEIFSPDRSLLSELVRTGGPNLFYKSVDKRKECCYVRKIEPLQRALSGKKAWICGVRKDQSLFRNNASAIEWDENFSLYKINPLIGYSNDDVWTYIRKNNVPYNKLHDKGFVSIGCQPCTRAVNPGDSERSGRWWWESEEKKECGLHLKKSGGKKEDNFNFEKINTEDYISAGKVGDKLDKLETQGVFILREAYKEFKNLCMLWSIGKDSTVLLYLARKAFFGHVPFPLVHIDTNYKIPLMITFRDELVRKWKIDLVYGQNVKALRDKKTFPDGNCDRITCCKNLKTEALKHTLSGEWTRYRFDHEKDIYVEDANKDPYTGVIVGVRSDEEGSRSKERYFSPRDKQNEWDVANQPPEMWNQFKTDFAPGTHIRVHPLLDWTELDIWEYIERENIPVIPLYFNNGDGLRYRSLGCYPCTHPIKSPSKNIAEIIEELKSGALKNIAERSGRAQDKEDGGLETLRKDGYM